MIVGEFLNIGGQLNFKDILRFVLKFPFKTAFDFNVGQPLNVGAKDGLFTSPIVSFLENSILLRESPLSFGGIQ
jgi:hypothetical protein